MDTSKYDFYMLSIVAAAIVGIIVTVVVFCTATCEKDSSHSRDVQIACLNNGNQWIDGNCIKVPV